jgi:multiple antibiotic resistance protein
LPTYDTLINAFATMFVTIDPPGLAPIFLALTAGMTREQRVQVAWRAALVAFVVLIGFQLAGMAILSTLGITIHAFRVAGGLLLFYIAFEMVFEKRRERKEQSSEIVVTRDHIANIAVFPLAIPLTAGPGAISATVLLSTQMGDTLVAKLLLASIVAGVVALVLASFALADRLDKYLGQTGRTILSRLLGLLLAALAVQFVADGVKALA